MKTNSPDTSLDDRVIPVPFLPHRRVSKREVLWALTIGLWPVVIWRIFSDSARKRKKIGPA